MPVGNLEFIKSASGSSVSSLSVTDCFSAKYDVYYLTSTKMDITNTDEYIGFRYIDSGGVDSTSNYDYAHLNLNAYSSFGEGRATNLTRGVVGLIGNTPTTSLAGLSFYVFNPYQSSSYTFGLYQGASVSSSGFQGMKVISVHTVAEIISGIYLFPLAGSFDNITVNVYGVK